MRSAQEKSESVPGSWRGRCPGRMGSGCGRLGALFKVLENLFDDSRVFNTGNHFNGTATMLTGFNVDIEYSLQPLRPSHGSVSLYRRPCFTFRGSFTTGCWRNLFSQSTIGREYAMEPGQVYSRPGHQSRKPCHEIQWLQYNVRGPVSIRCFECVANISLIGECHTLSRYCWPGYISTQPLQLAALMRLRSDPGMY